MGNPFVHFELNTTDVAAAKKFYGKIFDWQYTEMPAMNYTMFKATETNGGGMMVKPMPEAPTQWLCYVEVESVKATIAKAKKAGAQIKVEYQPIPNMGAFGIFIDPTGAGLGVWEKGAAAPAASPAKKASAPAKKAPAAARKAPVPAKKASAPAKKAPAASTAAAPAKASKPPAPAKKGAKKS